MKGPIDMPQPRASKEFENDQKSPAFRKALKRCIERGIPRHLARPVAREMVRKPSAS